MANVKIINDKVKSKTMQNREERIIKYELQIEELQEKLEEEKMRLAQEENDILIEQTENMIINFKELNINITLDEFVEEVKKGNVKFENINPKYKINEEKPKYTEQ